MMRTPSSSHRATSSELLLDQTDPTSNSEETPYRSRLSVPVNRLLVGLPDLSYQGVPLDIQARVLRYIYRSHRFVRLVSRISLTSDPSTYSPQRLLKRAYGAIIGHRRRTLFNPQIAALNLARIARRVADRGGQRTIASAMHWTMFQA